MGVYRGTNGRIAAHRLIREPRKKKSARIKAILARPLVHAVILTICFGIAYTTLAPIAVAGTVIAGMSTLVTMAGV